MKIILFIAAVSISCTAQSSDIFGFYPYIRLGIGYKFQEPDHVIYNNEKLSVSFGGKDSALIEAGFERGNFSIGIKHDSQWSTGWPINNREEYYKTEAFLSYKWGGKP